MIPTTNFLTSKAWVMTTKRMRTRMKTLTRKRNLRTNPKLPRPSKSGETSFIS